MSALIPFHNKRAGPGRLADERLRLGLSDYLREKLSERLREEMEKEQR